MTHLVCAKCGKRVDSIVLTLWNGKNGFRKYPLCPPCVKTVKDEKKVTK
jgi:hypothetical protein